MHWRSCRFHVAPQRTRSKFSKSIIHRRSWALCFTSVCLILSQEDPRDREYPIDACAITIVLTVDINQAPENEGNTGIRHPCSTTPDEYSGERPMGVGRDKIYWSAAWLQRYAGSAGRADHNSCIQLLWSFFRLFGAWWAPNNQHPREHQPSGKCFHS